MKKTYIFTTLLMIVGFMLSSCKEPAQPEPEKQPEIAITSANPMNVEAPECEVFVTYEVINPATNGSVTADNGGASWVKNFNYETPGKVIFVIEENQSQESRSAELVIEYSYPTADALVSDTLVINQSGKSADPLLDITTEDLSEFGYEGGDGSFGFTLINEVENGELKASADEEWVSDVIVEESKVSFSVSMNEMEEKRSCEVTLSYLFEGSSIEDKITISQAGKPLPPVLTLSENEFSVEAQGSGLSVGYALENPVEGVSVAATSDVDWITGFDYSTANTIEFNVAENSVEEERIGIVTFVYDYSDIEEPVVATATVTQAAAVHYDYTLEAACCHVDYYESYGNNGEDLIYIILSDNGLDESGYNKPNSKYVNIGLYTAERQEDWNNIKIPDGTYSFGDGTDNFTLNSQYCKYEITGSDGYAVEEFWINAGSVIVSNKDGKTEIEVLIYEYMDGKSIHATYSGPVSVVFDAGYSDASTLWWSTTVMYPSEDEIKAEVVNRGDQYGTGAVNWSLYIGPDEGYAGQGIQLDFCTEDASTIAGSYWASDTHGANTFFPGYYEGGEFLSSWLLSWKANGRMGSTRARMDAGCVTISDNEDGTYNVNLNVYDEKGTSINGSYVGAITIID